MAEPFQDEDAVFRGLRPRWVADGEISDAAFFRRPEKDALGVSIDRTLAAATVDSPMSNIRRAAELPVGEIRNIEGASETGMLNVFPDERTEEFPLHGYIREIPPYSPASQDPESLALVVEALRIAKALKQISQLRDAPK